jgi:hypothetical protein
MVHMSVDNDGDGYCDIDLEEIVYCAKHAGPRAVPSPAEVREAIERLAGDARTGEIDTGDGFFPVLAPKRWSTCLSDDLDTLLAYITQLEAKPAPLPAIDIDAAISVIDSVSGFSAHAIPALNVMFCVRILPHCAPHS